MSDGNYILQMKNISKLFPGVRALDSVHLDVKRGEVHALMGENGAGKSTLMKCLIGIQPVSSGEIIFDGRQLPQYYTTAAFVGYIHDPSGTFPRSRTADYGKYLAWKGAALPNRFGQS